MVEVGSSMFVSTPPIDVGVEILARAELMSSPVLASMSRSVALQLLMSLTYGALSANVNESSPLVVYDV